MVDLRGRSPRSLYLFLAEMMGNFLVEILRIFGAAYPLLDLALVMQAGLVAGLPLLGRALVMQANGIGCMMSHPHGAPLWVRC